MTTEEYRKKDEMFHEKLGITTEDLMTFYKVQKYYYIMDAFSWCSDNGYDCDDELAERMAGYVENKHDSNMSHWDNFEAAYYACTEG